MISINTFTPKEFNEKAKNFAQAIANKFPGSTVIMRDDAIPQMNYIISYVITFQHRNKTQHTLLGLNMSHQVEMINVFGEI